MVNRIVLVWGQLLADITRELRNNDRVISGFKNNIGAGLIHDAIVAKKPYLILATRVVLVSKLERHLLDRLPHENASLASHLLWSLLVGGQGEKLACVAIDHVECRLFNAR